VQRFVQEARSVNQIGHHNIVDIFAFGQLPNGRHYYVMEYLPGQSLKNRLRSDKPFSWAEAFRVLAAVCDALAAAHAAGIVHRDLKPDNIYLVEGHAAEPIVKLLDFGIAKLLRHGEDSSTTRTGAPIGTPFYMSPEQCRSKPVDARCDLYAMGVITFELFTGRLPFPGPDYIDTVNGHLMQPPALPSDYAPGLPGELESLILRCLEKEPDHRPGSAAEIAETLRKIAQMVPADAALPPRVHAGAETVPQPLRVPTPRSQPPVAARSSSASLPGAAPKSNRGFFIMAAAALLVALSAAMLFWGSRTNRTTPAGAPQIALEISSEPPGAQILVDGRARPERTPARLELPWAAEIAVRVELANYKPYDEVVRLPAGAPSAKLAAKLEPQPASLRVRTNTRDATFQLDGSPVAAVAGVLALDKLAPGAHKLRCEARGFEPREESVLLSPAQTAALDWTLLPVAGKKRPRSNLPDAPTTDFHAP